MGGYGGEREGAEGSPFLSQAAGEQKWYLLWRGGFERENEFASVNFHICVNSKMFVQQLRLSIKEAAGDQDQSSAEESIWAGSSFDISEYLISFSFNWEKNMCQSS